MSDKAPEQPLVRGAKRATMHFGKALYELASGLGALAKGVRHTVKPPPDVDDLPNTQKIPVD